MLDNLLQIIQRSGRFSSTFCLPLLLTGIQEDISVTPCGRKKELLSNLTLNLYGLLHKELLISF